MNRAKQRGKKRGNIIDSIKISDTLQNLIDRLSLIRKNSIYVFPTIRGSHYTLSGFKGMWGKIMAEAKEQKIVGAEGFTFHDLRAYYVTQYKQLHDGKLPDLHSNPQTTARIYDRLKEVKRGAI